MALEEIKRAMLSGEIYDPMDPELVRWQQTRIQSVNEYNSTPASKEGLAHRETMLKNMFREIGDGCYIEPPFHANLGGAFVKFGKGVYANFNLTLVDDGEITVGDGTLIGPNVTLATAAHPMNPTLRGKGLQYNLPIRIGKNVWIGSGAVILPGVSVGDNSVIGAGAIVTKDVPAGVVAAGNPCRVIRAVTEEDLTHYDHGKPIPEELLKRYL